MISIASISGAFYSTAADDQFFYVVGTSGMVVLDRDTSDEIAYLPATSGYSDVWTDEGTPFVFLATSGNGLHRVVKDPSWSGDISSYAYQYMTSPALQSDVVLSVHGLNADELVIGTDVGVQYIQGNSIFSSTDLAPVTSVKLVESEHVYYAGSFGIAKKEGPVNSDWVYDDLLFLLDNTTVPALTVLPVNDFDVVQTDDETVLAIATPSGVTVIREKSEQLIRSSSVLQIFKG
jgi:hypothetical protein